MSGGMPMMLLVVGILGAGAYLIMKRCDLLGICDDGGGAQQPIPIPEPVPAPEPEEEPEDEEPVNQTVIINNEGTTEYVPYPVPVPGRPVIVGRPPPPRPLPPRCSSRIHRHGVSYTLTNLARLPSAMIMIFPPQFIKEGNCVYQRTGSPPPRPEPRPLPRPQEVSRSCCKCKTTGYDNEVKCSNDGGKTWTTNTRYKYNISSSLNECVKKCRPFPTPSPLPNPFPWPDRDGDRKCTDPYCKQYPSRCKHCTQTSTANYGALSLYSNRMSF